MSAYISILAEIMSVSRVASSIYLSICFMTFRPGDTPVGSWSASSTSPCTSSPNFGCFEPKLFLCQSRVRCKIRDITTTNNVSSHQRSTQKARTYTENIPTPNDLMFIVKSSCFSHSLQNIEDAHAFAFAKIVSFVTSVVGAIVKYSGLRS